MKEDAFIFNAAKLHLAEDNIAELKELAVSGLDWSALAKKASSHGISQFLLGFTQLKIEVQLLQEVALLTHKLSVE